MLPGWNQIRQHRLPSQHGGGNHQQQHGHGGQQWGMQNMQQGFHGSGPMMGGNFNPMMNNQGQEQQMMHAAQGDMQHAMMDQQGMYNQQQQFMHQQQNMYNPQMMAYNMNNQQMMHQLPNEAHPPAQPPPPAPVPPPPPPSDEERPAPPQPPPPEEEKWWDEELVKLNAMDKAKLERLTKEQWFLSLKKEQQVECWQHKLQLVSKQKKTSESAQIKKDFVPAQNPLKKTSNPMTAQPTATAQQAGSMQSETKTDPIAEWNSNAQEDPQISLAQYQQQLLKLTQQEEMFVKQYEDWHKQFEDWKRKHKDHPNKSQFAQYEKQWVTWQDQMSKQKAQNRANIERLHSNIRKVQEHLAKGKNSAPNYQAQHQLNPNMPGGQHQPRLPGNFKQQQQQQQQQGQNMGQLPQNQNMGPRPPTSQQNQFQHAGMRSGTPQQFNQAGNDFQQSGPRFQQDGPGGNRPHFDGGQEQFGPRGLDQNNGQRQRMPFNQRGSHSDDNFSQDETFGPNAGPRQRMPGNQQRFRAPGGHHGPRFPGQQESRQVRPNMAQGGKRPRMPGGAAHQHQSPEEDFEQGFGEGGPSLPVRHQRPRFPGSHQGRMPLRQKGPRPRFQGNRFRGPEPRFMQQEGFIEEQDSYEEYDDFHDSQPNAPLVRGPRPRFPGGRGDRFVRPMQPRFPGDSPSRPQIRQPSPGQRLPRPPVDDDSFKEDSFDFGAGSFETEGQKLPENRPEEIVVKSGQGAFVEELSRHGSTSSVGSNSRPIDAGLDTRAGGDVSSKEKINLPTATKDLLANNPLFKGDNLKKLQEHIQAIKTKPQDKSAAPLPLAKDGSEDKTESVAVDRSAILERAKKLSNLDLRNILSAVKTVKEKKPSTGDGSTLENINENSGEAEASTSGGKDSKELDKEAIEAALLERLGLDPALAKAKPNKPSGDPLLDAIGGLDTLHEFAGIKDDILMQEYLKLDPQLERELLLRAIRDRELLEEAQRLDPLYNQSLEMQWAEERRALEMSTLSARPFDMYGPPGPWHPMGPRGPMPGPPFMGPGRPPYGPGPRMPPMGPHGPMGPRGPRMGPGGPFMRPPIGPGMPPLRPSKDSGPTAEEKLYDIDGKELGKESDRQRRRSGDRRSPDDARRNSRSESEYRERSRERSPFERSHSRQRDSIERGRQAVHEDLETLKRHREILGRERHEKENEERSEHRERSLERLRAIEDDLRKREQLLLQREKDLNMARSRFSPGRRDFRDEPPRRPYDDSRPPPERRRSPYDDHRMAPGSPPRYDRRERRSRSLDRGFEGNRRRNQDDRGYFREERDGPPRFDERFDGPGRGRYDDGPPERERQYEDRQRGPDFRLGSPREIRHGGRRSMSPPSRRGPPANWRDDNFDRRRDSPGRGERISPPRRINRSPPLNRDRPSPKRERLSERMSPRRFDRRIMHRTPPRGMRRSRSRSRSPPPRGGRDRFGRDVTTNRDMDPFGRDLNLRGGGRQERSPKHDFGPPSLPRNMERPMQTLARDSPAQSSSGRGTPLASGPPSIADIAASIKRKLLAPAYVYIADLIDMPGRMRRPAKIVVILRGLPGSGKTHIAKMIREKETNFGVKPRVLGLDDYFMAEVEKVEKDPDSGKKIKKKVFEYEFEPEMEDSYRSNLLRSFKKTLEDGFFSFIIVDAVNEKVTHFSDFYEAAKNSGFEAYVAEIKCDPHVCAKRNIHKRTLSEIQKIDSEWEETAIHMNKLDVRLMMQDSEIQEVEMDDVSDEEKQENQEKKEKPREKSASLEPPEERGDLAVQKSKWESESTAARLDKLDGIAKKTVKRSMEDFLSLPDDYETRESEPGKKRVRWADINERKTQQRMRDVGFVVGQTDWSRMMDESHATRALNRTKFI